MVNRQNKPLNGYSTEHNINGYSTVHSIKWLLDRKQH